MVDKNLQVLREVGDIESAMWLTDRATPINICFIAEISGTLEMETLRQALRFVQKRHALLRVRVLLDRSRLFFAGWEGENHPPIPLRSAPASMGSWVEVAEEEISTPFDTQHGLLVRCTVIPRAHGMTLLLTLHHMIGDGLSASYLVRDILRSCDRMRMGASGELAVLELPLPMERHLPDGISSRGMGGMMHISREWWKQRKRCQQLGERHRGLRVECEAPFLARRRRILPLRFSPEVTARIRQRAREEKTTVHGALGAALCLALYPDLVEGGERAVMGLGSPVNLRKRLNPPVDGNCALYAALSSTFHQISGQTELWELAREIRRETVASVERGRPFALALMAGYLGRNRVLLPFDEKGVARNARLSERVVRASVSTGLTNIGEVKVEPALETLTLESASFVPSQAFFGFVAATACTVHDTLSVNFLVTEPMVDPARGRVIANRLRAEILKSQQSPAIPPRSAATGD